MCVLVECIPTKGIFWSLPYNAFIVFLYSCVIDVSPLVSQEEYYVTHQCFLSSRSLYLAVWNVTHGERGIEELGPWLHNIQVCKPHTT